MVGGPEPFSGLEVSCEGARLTGDLGGHLLFDEQLRCLWEKMYSRLPLFAFLPILMPGSRHCKRVN